MAPKKKVKKQKLSNKRSSQSPVKARVQNVTNQSHADKTENKENDEDVSRSLSAQSIADKFFKHPTDTRFLSDDQTEMTVVVQPIFQNVAESSCVEESEERRQLQDISQSYPIDDKLSQIVKEVQISMESSDVTAENLLEAELLRQQHMQLQQQQQDQQHQQQQQVEQGQVNHQNQKSGQIQTIDFIVLETENLSGGRSGEKRKLAEALREIDDNAVKLKKLKKNDEKLELDCEWSECISSLQSWQVFMEHVRLHIQDTQVRQGDNDSEYVFVCLWEDCGFECANSSEMVRHINYHSFHTKLKSLGLNMIKSQGLKGCTLDTQQRNLFQDFTEPFKCKWSFCPESEHEFHHPQHFYWHVANHGDDVKKFDCKWDDCTKRDFASKTRLKEHLRSHSQEKLIACPTCGASFASRVKLFDHLKRQQVSSANFTCTNCNKSFALERLLRDHMRSHINTYECGDCGMCWPTPSSLQTHIKYRHSKARDFPCEKCDYKAKSHHDLKLHARGHEGDVLSCIEGCGFVCKSNSVMKNHFLKKHMESARKYACHLCEAVFGRGALLTCHLKKKHEITSTSRFRYSRDESTGLYRVQLYRFELQDEEREENNLEIDTEVESLCQGSPAPSSITYHASHTPSSLQPVSPTPSSVQLPSPTPSSIHHPSPVPTSQVDIVAIRSQVSDSIWSREESVRSMGESIRSMGDSMRSMEDSVRSSAASVHSQISADGIPIYAYQDLGYEFPMGDRTYFGEEESQNPLNLISEKVRKSSYLETDITKNEFCG